MIVEEYLRLHHKSPMPDWLRAFEFENPVFDAEAFFSSRVVYYPGAYTDGHPVKVFGGSHSAHCFVMVDYWLGEQELDFSLSNQEGAHPFMGYEVQVKIAVGNAELVRHSNPSDLAKYFIDGIPVPKAVGWQKENYSYLMILGRRPAFTDDHGPERLALLFLASDAHVTYEALFCQEGQSPPFGMLLQDHGWGGNYSRFDKGNMFRYAARAMSFPTFILTTNDDTSVWPGYEQIPDVEYSIGGMHQNRRFLFKLDEEYSRRRRFHPRYGRYDAWDDDPWYDFDD